MSSHEQMITLNSIMFLLIRNSDVTLRSSKRALNSIMFLLILFATVENNRNHYGNFKFHYVSINSDTKQIL